MRVVLSFDYCGKCRNCLAGRPAVCYELLERNFRCQRADGTTALSSGDQAVHSHFLGQSAFATYAVSPARCAIKVDSSIPMTTLAPFGCGIQTGAGAILNTLEPRPGDSVAVFGMGAVGLAAVMAAKISECETVIGIDPVPSRRTLAKELGATHVIDPGEHDPVGAIREITGPGANFSVEASGADGVVSAAMDGLAPGGSCALVGTPTAGTEISLNIEEFMSAARTMRTVLLGDGDPASFIPRLVAYWEGGRLPVERMVSPFQLEQINSAVELATSGEIVKPVLDLTI